MLNKVGFCQYSIGIHGIPGERENMMIAMYISEQNYKMKFYILLI